MVRYPTRDVPELGVVFRRTDSLVIDALTRHSPLRKAGLRPHQEIQRINETVVATPRDLKQHVDCCEGAVTIEFLSFGKLKSASVQPIPCDVPVVEFGFPIIQALWVLSLVAVIAVAPILLSHRLSNLGFEVEYDPLKVARISLFVALILLASFQYFVRGSRNARGVLAWAPVIAFLIPPFVPALLTPAIMATKRAGRWCPRSYMRPIQTNRALGNAMLAIGITLTISVPVSIALEIEGLALVDGILGPVVILWSRRVRATVVVRDFLPLEKPFILFLRPFAGESRSMGFTPWRLVRRSFEERALDSIERCNGIILSIGDPRSDLPRLGGSTMLLGVDDWQGYVSSLIQDAAFIVVRPGRGSGLKWEVDQILKHHRFDDLAVFVDNHPYAEVQGVLELLGVTAPKSDRLPAQGMLFMGSGEPKGIVEIADDVRLIAATMGQRIVDEHSQQPATVHASAPGGNLHY